MDKKSRMEQIFDYFLVLDFEATCSDSDPKYKNEIIEFPIVALDAKTGKIVSEFREYVRPLSNIKLTEFCTNLTGIEQKTVDAADMFPAVFKRAQTWYKKFNADHPGARSIFITCGDWDLDLMLPRQAEMSGVKIPAYFKKWVNIKVPFSCIVDKGSFGMVRMLRYLNLPLTGRHHSGLDDSRNIAAIVYALVQRGVIIAR